MDQDFTDPMDIETVRCPFPFYESLRNHAGPWDLPNVGFSLIGRYEDVSYALADVDDFTAKVGPGLSRRMTPEVRAVLAEGYPRMNTLLANDPPSHTRYRSLVKSAFSPRRVRSMEPSVRRVAQELAADLAAAGDDADFVELFAQKLPLMVIADALGVPRKDLPAFKRWSDDSVAPLGGMITPERELECHRSVNELQAYMVERIEERRAAPQDDLLTDLIQAQTEDQQPLTIPEILAIVHVILVAGNETTTNLISSCMLMLLDHPDVEERARTDSDYLARVVEETLRREAPVQGTGRMNRGQVSLADEKVTETTRIMAMIGAANLDESVFENAQDFNPERSNVRSHLAFGKGIHTCLGSSLARLEALVAFEELFATFERFGLAANRDALAYHPNFILRALESLPLQTVAQRSGEGHGCPVRSAAVEG
ncbi:cytochrome P450 [Nocardioides endophyticus]|uniref:Cytochrome P450 n=1 Tax=Nocardioides endophyticus TaxID=1353775 RepID=A0ABP8YH07_9ACTN